MTAGVFAEETKPGRPPGRLLEERLAAAVNGLMATAEGRAFLRWLLAACRCFEAEAPAPGAAPLTERLIYAEGARQVGMRVLRLLEAAAPAHFPNLLLTREDDDGRIGCRGGRPDGHADSPGGYPAAGLRAR